MKKDTCTIYLLTNLINKKIYVGQSWMLLQHRMGKDGSNYRNSPYLYAAIQKYGVENFEYTKVLAECQTQEEANKLEDHYMDVYDSRNPDIGYNIKRGGSNGTHSEETIKKISETLKKQYEEMSDEEKAARAAPISGYWKDKSRGPHSEEQKKNISDKMKEWHADNIHPMLGKHHTEEARQKQSEAFKGKKRPPESVKKSAEARKMPPEREQAIIQAYLNGDTIKSIRERFGASVYRVLNRNNIPRLKNFKKWTGKKHSPETIQKMREGQKAAREKRRKENKSSK